MLQGVTGAEPGIFGAVDELMSSRQQVQCLVQLHMWMLLMAHTERLLGTSLDTDMHTLVNTWQSSLDQSELSLCISLSECIAQGTR